MNTELVTLIVCGVAFVGALVVSVVWALRLTKRIPDHLNDFPFDSMSTTSKAHWWK